MRHAAVLFRTLVPAILLGASVVAASPRDALVVSNAWLAAHLADPDLVILHVGHATAKADFEKAHIPGAQLIEVGTLAKRMDHSAMKPGDLTLEMPAPEELRKQLTALGISDRSRIVVYYADDLFTHATRVVQTLNYAGLGAQSMLLENSLRKWVSEGRPTAVTSAPPKPGSLSPLKIQPVIVDAAFVRAQLRTPGYVIVDARDGVFYDGTRAGSGKNGHIAGAVSLPYSTLADDESTLKPADQLAAIFAKAGIKAGDKLIAYCHIGQQATGVVFAARTLGFDVVLYDGSMEDWSRQKDAPIEVVKKGGN
ncbi:MAG TPA: rhodanese-like domain-containing protein [Vicinamibacterales bacterium]|nr:rhodanese-like domain-containing protein [Vicinamibacterales bacterium]